MTLATNLYLCVSVVLWLTAMAQAVRFNEPFVIRAGQAVMTIWPAAVLAGGAL